MKHLTIALGLFILLSANKCKNDADGGAMNVDPTSSISDTKWVVRSLGGTALDLPEGVEKPGCRWPERTSRIRRMQNLMGTVHWPVMH